jgi:hypothetical protein
MGWELGTIGMRLPSLSFSCGIGVSAEGVSFRASYSIYVFLRELTDVGHVREPALEGACRTGTERSDC